MECLRDEDGKTRGFAKILRDATAQKEAEDERRRVDEERQRFVSLAENSTDFIGMCGLNGLPFFVNDAGLRMVGLDSSEQMMRTVLRDYFFPEDQDFVQDEFIPQVLRDGRGETEVRLRHFKTGEAVWVLYKVFTLPDALGRPIILATVSRDITEARRAQHALRASEEALRENEARLWDAQIRLESARAAGGIATWTLDVASDCLMADANLARLFCVSPEDAASGNLAVYLQAIHPDDRSRVTEAIMDALAHGQVYEVEYRVVLPDGAHRWLVARGRVVRDAEGQAVTLPGVVVDITEQVERGRRERFLAELAERARVLAGPDEVIADAVRSVGRFLGLSRCTFADIDLDANTCAIRHDYCADAAVASIVGVFPLSSFGSFIVSEFMVGRTVVVDDVQADPIRVPEGSLATYEAIGVRAHVTAPVVHSARLVCCIGAHCATPRHWKPEDVEMVQTVVERTWLTVEVLRQQQALAGLAEQQRARAERESLLNRIGEALRASPDPETVLATAVRELGQALGADRCYYAAYDQDTDTVTVGPDWHRATLPTLTGQYPISPYSMNHDSAYRAGHTQVLPDTSGDAAALTLGLRALVRVPLVFGASMTALSVAMTDGPRAWSADEVSLVEAVATQTQTALEAVRVQRREHRIAEQLQAALQPPLPAHVPGLAVSKYYEAALAEEAGVGGDFYDCFPIDEGCTALVVGDLSGKGLAGAAQVSIVRNMLRAFLYAKRTGVEAVTDLNRSLAENALLSGFSTLFVGLYDSRTRVLNYVNCGQEPALVRRGATGAIEQLGSTGFILGPFKDGHFTEEAVPLAPGDALAIFTDGFTEIGPSRAEMLGIEGVAALLGEPFTTEQARSAAEKAELLALRLITGVDKAAQGGVMRDDACLLVAVVE